MEAKGNIRKEVFARRRAATQEEIQEKSRMIYEKITALREGPANGKDGRCAARGRR